MMKQGMWPRHTAKATSQLVQYCNERYIRIDSITRWPDLRSPQTPPCACVAFIVSHTTRAEHEERWSLAPPSHLHHPHRRTTVATNPPRLGLLFRGGERWHRGVLRHPNAERGRSLHRLGQLRPARRRRPLRSPVGGAVQPQDEVGVPVSLREVGGYVLGGQYGRRAVHAVHQERVRTAQGTAGPLGRGDGRRR